MSTKSDKINLLTTSILHNSINSARRHKTFQRRQQLQIAHLKGQFPILGYLTTRWPITVPARNTKILELNGVIVMDLIRKRIVVYTGPRVNRFRCLNEVNRSVNLHHRSINTTVVRAAKQKTQVSKKPSRSQQYK